MDSIHIKGGIPLEGQTKIQGSKNAVLPVLAATILIPGISVIHNCPKISDVFYMIKLLQSLGCNVVWEDNTIVVDATHIMEKCLPSEYVIKMRSSITLLGSMLARVGEISLQYPGGCVIGDRPVDMHCSALETLGAVFEEKEQGFIATAQCLVGTVITFPSVSVGATENIILAATLASGTTIIKNAAKEPEIIALCEFLTGAGARINGIGSDVLTIQGVKTLRESTYTVISDRIVAGTYALAGLAVGCDIFLENAPIEHMEAILDITQKLGGRFCYDINGLWIYKKEQCHSIPYVRTAVYPGFPTDLQSPLMAVLTGAEGDSIIEETIFANRYKVVTELNLMGANIRVEGGKALIQGNKTLYGNHIIAEELRGGAALAIAGIMASGDTVVSNKHFIDRGYEDMISDLNNLGACVASI